MPNVFQSIGNSVRSVHAFLYSYAAFQDVPGWLAPIEGYALELLAAEGPGQGEVLEIGSFKGRSTCFLAHGLSKSGRGRVTAVDHFQGSTEHQTGEDFEVQEVAEGGDYYHVFEDSLRRHELLDLVDVRRLPSREAVRGWRKPLRLLFIDGEHTYDAVKEDFALWSRFVEPGGVLAFHDYESAHGVTAFCDELLANQAEFRPIMKIESLLVTLRRER